MDSCSLRNIFHFFRVKMKGSQDLKIFELIYVLTVKTLNTRHRKITVDLCTLLQTSINLFCISVNCSEIPQKISVDLCRSWRSYQISSILFSEIFINFRNFHTQNPKEIEEICKDLRRSNNISMDLVRSSSVDLHQIRRDQQFTRYTLAVLESCTQKLCCIIDDELHIWIQS